MNSKDAYMRVVVGRTIVIVNVLLRGIIVDEEVVVDLAPLHDHVRLARAHRREVRLAVPAVEGSVVTALAARGEDQVVADLIAASEAVVRIDATVHDNHQNII